MVVRQEVEAVEEVVTEGDAKVVLQTRLFFSAMNLFISSTI